MTTNQIRSTTYIEHLSVWTRTPFSDQNFAKQNHCTSFRGGGFSCFIYIPLPNNTTHQTIAIHFLNTYIVHLFLIHSVTFLTPPSFSSPKKIVYSFFDLIPARGIKNRKSGSYYCKSINGNLQAHTHIHIYKNDKAFLHSTLNRPTSTIHTLMKVVVIFK